MSSLFMNYEEFVFITVNVVILEPGNYGKAILAYIRLSLLSSNTYATSTN